MATVLERFLPMKVSGVRPGHGSFFTIDLDSNTGKRRCLWIYLCGWAIINGRDGAMDSDCSKIEIDDFLLKRWNPSRLLSANINSRAEIDFKFDKSSLRLFPYPKTYGLDADIFRFFENGKVYYLKFRDNEMKEAKHGEGIVENGH